MNTLRPRSETSAAGEEKRSWVRLWLADSTVLVASQSLTVLATSLAAILIARSLPPDEWGLFSGFFGLSLAVALVAGFGVSTWLLRELSRMFEGAAGETAEIRSKAATLLTAGVALNVLLGCGFVAVGIAWSVLAGFQTDVAVALVSMLVYSALTTSANALETHLRARRRVRRVATALVVEKTTLIALVAASLIADGGLAWFGLAYIVAGVVRVAFDTVTLAAQGTPFRLPGLGAIGAVARGSYPFALTAGSINLAPRLDTLLIAAISATSAGWFAIGDRVLGPAFLVAATAASALYPFMADRARRARPPWALAGALAGLGAAMLVVGYVLAPFLIPLLFGEAYREAVPIAQVMLLVLPFFYATEPLLVYAYSNGRERSVVVATLGLSVIGSATIVLGQLAGGASYAAAGYVVRSVLLFVGVAAVAATVRRAARKETGVEGSLLRLPATAVRTEKETA
jgi:O-antigen/teichoic acid export membrane protein